MIITKIEILEKAKVKVFIDEGYAFMLHQKDLVQYPLKDGSEISTETYDEILEKLIWERAKQKALTLLKFTDRCELELKRKLSDAGYTESIIERTISYVKHYGYLDDRRYAANYIKARMERKSKLVIKSELLQKGICHDILDGIMETEYGEDEDAELLAIKKCIAKKTRSPEELTYDEKQKLIASLYRKGFAIGKIKQILL